MFLSQYTFHITTFFLLLTVSCTPKHAHAHKKQAEIHLYPSFVDAQGRWKLHGRVLYKSRWITPQTSGKLRNMFSMFRRFTRKGVPFLRLTIHVSQQKREVLTDREGRFQLTGQRSRTKARPSPSSSPSQTPSSKATSTSPQALSFGQTQVQTPRSMPASTLNTEHKSCTLPTWWSALHPKPQKRIKASGYIPILVARSPQQTNTVTLLPTTSFLVREHTQESGMHVISDIDDTLIWTHVTQKAKMLKNMMFSNATQVKVIDGAKTFLRHALCRTNTPGTLHYLSGSPRQLFDRIRGIFSLRQFPLGSLTLKPITGPKTYPLGAQQKYKIESIQRIMRAFPKRRFLMLGDNGEHDPHIYNQIRKQFPKQIKAIFIHQVKSQTT
ncbi:MAG: phosphatase domain-containing protein, partial [Myxococcota bacterium]